MNTLFFKTSIILFLILGMNSHSQKATRSTQEVKDMKYMLEEEKLARDVYWFLDNTWGLKVFNNIKRSEQMHMDFMENLLKTTKTDYELYTERGFFYNKQLQTLYDDLIEKGSKSVQDALEVGKTIEITDIDDLEKAIRNTDKENAIEVYSRLLFGSNNHLRAFNRNLSRF